MHRATATREIGRKSSPSGGRSRRAPTKFLFCSVTNLISLENTGELCKPANATLQATAADMYNVNLVLTAELAADYFSLRELDAETRVVQESVDIQQKGLQSGGEPSCRRSRLRARPGAAADPARFHGHATVPGAAATRTVRTRHRGADRKSRLHLQRSGRTAACALRRRSRWVCLPTCWSGGPMSLPPSATWRTRTPKSELPPQRFIRNSPSPAAADFRAPTSPT